ncbi:hypothetical protein MKW98_024992 [Papaver atlanticum]|uniref:F-box domain-containing protein n=1 Tax=Papaver atlanticum TaxID=357466 RepID=A0AAD4SZT2_9MAGN|nr:hypothetical protein MKW98_024992 [Papaver atlanticum]
MRNKNRKKGTSRSIIDSENDDKSNVVLDEDIVCDILSRLPVKSLLRFKCVSKRWCSLIQDPYFVDLHFARSKARQHLLVAEPLPQKLNRRNVPGNMTKGRHPMHLLTAETFLQERGTVNSTTLNSVIHTMKNTNTFSFETYVGPVNGLICFTNKHSVCMYNISTRDVTPWVKSTLQKEVKEMYGKDISIRSHGFGFDPATKEYKVVCMWTGYIWETDNFWEVLTVGHNTWRKINDIPPYTRGFTDSGVYVNGSIYWCTWKHNGDADFIVAFDVGCEMLRTIQIPNFILHQPLELHVLRERFFQVLEVDGRIAILHKMSAYTVKVWIYEDGDKERSISTTTDTCENWWDEKSIILPVKWLQRRYLYFHTAVGAGQMILEIHRKDFTEFLYSYDWKRNTFKEIIITGIPSIEVHRLEKLFASYTESMFSVSPAEKKCCI